MASGYIARQLLLGYSAVTPGHWRLPLSLPGYTRPVLASGVCFPRRHLSGGHCGAYQSTEALCPFSRSQTGTQCPPQGWGSCRSLTAVAPWLTFARSCPPTVPGCHPSTSRGKCFFVYRRTFTGSRAFAISMADSLARAMSCPEFRHRSGRAAGKLEGVSGAQTMVPAALSDTATISACRECVMPAPQEPQPWLA